MDTLTGFTAKRDRPFGIVNISLPGEEKDQVLKEGFDPAYGARQGIVGIVMSKVFCRSRFI